MLRIGFSVLLPLLSFYFDLRNAAGEAADGIVSWNGPQKTTYPGGVYNMGMSWLKILDKPKDFLVKNALQYYFGRYGKRMLELSVDREKWN